MFQYKMLNKYFLFLFLFLTRKRLNCVLTADHKMKQLITFLLNVNLLSNYGVIWDIIVNVALMFQFLIHRLPLLDSLKLIIFFETYTTIIQILYLFVIKLFKAFICSIIEKIIFFLEKECVRIWKKNQNFH